MDIGKSYNVIKKTEKTQRGIHEKKKRGIKKRAGQCNCSAQKVKYWLCQSITMAGADQAVVVIIQNGCQVGPFCLCRAF